VVARRCQRIVARLKRANTAPPVVPRVVACRHWVLNQRFWSPAVEWPYPAIASGPDPRRLQPPMVLATCHIGEPWAVGALLENLPGEVLALRNDKGPAHRPMARAAAGSSDEWSRIVATKCALDTLRRGGFVHLAVDGWGKGAIGPSVLPGLPPWRAGAFALSRLADAPLLPVTARWRGRKLEIITGEPITPGDQAEMAAQFAHWVRGYLYAKPREILRFPAGRLAEALFEERPQLGVADLSVLGPGDRTGWEDADAVRREAQGGDDLAGDFGGYLLG